MRAGDGEGQVERQLLRLLQPTQNSLKVLCYKPEGRGFETRIGKLFLYVYLILLTALDPGVYSASNRNEYQKQNNNVSGE
jgi:hypothetical protein